MIASLNIVLLLSLVGVCSSKCPDTWTLVGDTCYGIVKKFQPAFKDVYEARETCVRNGGDISDIPSREIFDTILEIVRRHHPAKDGQLNYMGQFYIASNDIAVDDRYVLLSGKELEFEDWLPEEPNNMGGKESCVVVEARDIPGNPRKWGWADYSCCKNKSIPGVLCQMPDDISKRTNTLDPELNIFAWECYNHTDDCPSHDCLNGAACVDKLRRYECKCADGWKGKRCNDTVKCPPFPKWKGLETNSSQNVYGTTVYYTCLVNTTLTDGSTSQVTRCAGSGVIGQWDPPVLDCKPLPSQIITKITERTEAKNAVVVGTAAIVFLICEGVLMLLMDLNTLKIHAEGMVRNCLGGYLFAILRSLFASK